MNHSSLSVGIDVGGTHTDAAVLDQDQRLVAWTKANTTPDVSTGIRNALSDLIRQLDGQAPLIKRVMLGTTHGINAVLQRQGLCRVAVIRLGAPATGSIPPLTSWPEDLRRVVAAGTAILPGGNYVEGRSIASLDRARVLAFLDSCGPIDSVAITGVFSPAYRDHEIAVAEMVRSHLGENVGISLSHEVGSLGLLPRENATVLNAALHHVASMVSQSLTDILTEHAVDATTYFAQNDGTLMGLDVATQFPVLAIGSGPANSIRGAAFLTGMQDAIVADVGGTSTDFGVLHGGFPRESATGTDVAGVHTNFRMPDILSLSIGGGTVVRRDTNDVTVGPDSLGYLLTEGALCFGGTTATLTDAAVRMGAAEIGGHAVPEAWTAPLGAAMAKTHERLADAIESMNIGREIDSLVVVGGASFLVPNRQSAVSTVLYPEHGEVANAVGVAIAPVGGRWDTVIPVGKDRKRSIDEACEIASSRAVQAGADPRRVEIIEISETPIGYLDEKSSRIRVRAAGPLGATA